VSALFSPLLINLQFLLCRDASLYSSVLTPPPSRHIPYSPSDPLSYAPPYPISPSDPVTSISCYSCHVRLDHFRVEYTSSPVRINLLVQDVVFFARAWAIEELPPPGPLFDTLISNSPSPSPSLSLSPPSNSLLQLIPN
jgi:hypothetical protein